MLPEPIAVTVKVTALFEKLGIPYLIGGSLASAIYGLVRTTQDSDIVARLENVHISPLVQALENEFYIDAEMIADAIARRASFNMIHRETMFKVDIFISRQRAFDQSQLARASRQTIATEPKVEAMIASVEDTMLAKLEWYRMGGQVSERQWGDILGMLKVQAGRLDLDYLHRWAKELKVGDLLERALKQA